MEDLRFPTTELDLRTRVLESLYFPEMDARMEEISEAQAKTFQWIFVDRVNQRHEAWDNFAAWLEEGNDLYWIAGLPGAGKSTLMRFIHENYSTKNLLHKWAGDKPLIRVAFSLWNSGAAALQKNVCGLLRTCLYQIFRQCNQFIDAIVTPDLPSIPSWTGKRLWEALEKVFKSDRIPRCFFLLLDGLDELDKSQEELVCNILDLSQLSNVKFCVSSRQEPTFESAFKNRPKLRIQHLTFDDISTFTLHELMGKDNLRQGTDLSEVERQKLVELITCRAEGVFLWAKLATKSLNKVRQPNSPVHTFTVSPWLKLIAGGLPALVPEVNHPTLISTGAFSCSHKQDVSNNDVEKLFRMVDTLTYYYAGYTEL